MNVLLIQSGKGAENTDAVAMSQKMEHTIQPPIGLLSIGTFLQNHGHPVVGIDLYLTDTYRDLRDELIKNPHLIGIGFSTEKYENTRRIIQLCRELTPKSRIILGGPHVSFLPDETLSDLAADAAVIFDGELPMLGILEAMEKNHSLAGVPGVKTINGGTVTPQYIKNIDSLGFPDREIFNFEKYFDIHKKADSSCIRTSTVTYNRGCPNNCNFCVAPAIRKHVPIRHRSPEHFIDEILWMQQKYDINSFNIVDELFTQDVEQLSHICRILKEIGNINWRCEARVDNLSPELMIEMKEAGCYSIQIGIECADNKALRSMGKQTTVEQIRQVARWQKEIGGLKTHGVMIFGLPWDTRESVKRKIDFALELFEQGVLVMNSVLTPFPGTDIFNHPEKYGIRINSRDWSRYDFCDCVIDTRHLSSDEILESNAQFINRIKRYHMQKICVGVMPDYF